MNLILVTDDCTECGRCLADREEAGAYYCTECDRYIKPLPGTPLQAELDELPRIGDDMRADWQQSKFRVISGEAS
jgi:hypothetical protein